MIYSEIKERENRFIIALKIGFPFIALMICYILLIKVTFLKDNDIILLVILSLIYVYFIFYLIYFGFKSTLIDGITKTFNRTYMFELIEKNFKKNKSVILLKLSNIDDITNRYGVVFGDVVLKMFAVKLDNFLKSKKYANTPIGRYGGGYFIVLLNEKQNISKQLFIAFSNELKKNYIKGIEVKLDFVITSSSHDKSAKNIINNLLYQFDDDNDDMNDLLQLNVFNNLTLKAIKNNNFLFFNQSIFDLNTKQIKIYEILVKLNIDKFGSFTNLQLRKVINKNGYERIFDQRVIENLLPYIKNIPQNIKICIHVSPYVLRNEKFINFIKEKIATKNLNAKQIIFAFWEDKTYHDVRRFSEILNEYKKMGFSFLLNHFAGNNASLEYLKKLPIDYASFDLEFTKNLDNKRYLKILNLYIELLKSLNIISIAKFVENSYNYEILSKLKINMLQGYMIEKPKLMEKIDDKS